MATPTCCASPSTARRVSSRRARRPWSPAGWPLTMFAIMSIHTPHAEHRDALLATRDTKGFDHIDGLRLLNPFE